MRKLKDCPSSAILTRNKKERSILLLFHRKKAHSDFLSTQQEEEQQSVDPIPIKNVVGIGAYAVHIESAHAIIDSNEIPIAPELEIKNIGTIGADVNMIKGQLIGNVTEFLVAERQPR
ncbi:hypothetical protein NDK25_07525 [Niallia taxi]|nr:hypothetical protein [Niallia taxi]MDE5052257.1 hypothetical protein [Niallia taxi]